MTVEGGEDVEGRRAPSDEEIELLWAAASPAPDLARIAGLALRADVSYVLEVAAEQRVAPLAVAALRDAGVDVGPDDARLASAWQARSLLTVPVAARSALGALADIGITPLLLKGLALRDRYPSPGLRPMDDIDVLVPSERFDDAAAALVCAGWERGRHPHPSGDYDIPFLHASVPDLFLELHRELVDARELPPSLRSSALWAECRSAAAFGYDVRRVPPELEIVMLTTHAAKVFHRFDRLLWAVDLVIVAAADTIDWDDVGRRASAAQRRIATAIGLRLARRLGADVPDEAIEIPAALGRSEAVRIVTDPRRPFARETKNTDPWLTFSMIDDVAGMARMAIGDLREPPWGKSRVRVARELAQLVAHGAGALIRTKTAGLRGAR